MDAAPIEAAATIPADVLPAEPAIDVAPLREKIEAVAPTTPGTEAPIEIDQTALTGHSEIAEPSEPVFDNSSPPAQTSAAAAEAAEFAIDLTMPDLPKMKNGAENAEADAGIFKNPPPAPIKGLAALQVREEDFEHLQKIPSTPVEFPNPTPVSPEPPSAETVSPDEISVEPIPESLEPFGESKVDLDAFLSELESQVEPPHSSAIAESHGVGQSKEAHSSATEPSTNSDLNVSPQESLECLPATQPSVARSSRSPQIRPARSWKNSKRPRQAPWI